MSQSSNSDDPLQAIARVLLWCFVMSMALLLLWSCLIVFAGDMIYGVHSRFLDMTRQQFNLVHYALMVATKVGVFVLFLFPYVAIRLVQRAAKR